MVPRETGSFVFSRPIQIDNEELPYTDRFTYLDSIIIRDGGTDLNIQSRLNKARNSLNMMNKVWRSSTYSTRTKLKLYHSWLLTTLLYGSECWRLTEKDLSKLSIFHTKSLQRILRIFWLMSSQINISLNGVELDQWLPF